MTHLRAQVSRSPRNRFPFALPSMLALGCLFSSCASTASMDGPVPLAGGEPVDHLIEADEVHFKHLWKLTSGGENAEGYWSFAGDRLSLQRRNPDEGADCDRIFVTDPVSGELIPVSDGRGVTTCAHFMPGDQSVIYASTRGGMENCPPPVDHSLGYVWPLSPEYDLWIRDLNTGELRQLTSEDGYDAEATVSPTQDRIVFTSTRSGDIELWTADLDGGDLRQVTDEPGYDGGAFFSHDGKQLLFRSTSFSSENREQEIAAYRGLLAKNVVRPSDMEIMLINADGTNRRQLTQLGGANWAPYFFPDDKRFIFCSNHHSESAREFDLFAMDVDGENLEQITTYQGFDSFPMFSPDGRYFVFASNRGGSRQGETNLFLAQWQSAPGK